MADLKTSKITRLKIGYTNNESYLSESDSTALDILGDARIIGTTNLYGNLNIIQNNINLFQLNQDGVTIPTLNTTDLNINGTSFTDIQNNINSSISNSSSAAETNAKRFTSSEIAKLNKSHTDGKYISSISAPNGNGSSAAIAINETAFDSSVSLTSINGIQNKVITNYVDTKINNEKTARENKDTSLENAINLMQNTGRDGTLANKIQNLETIRFRYIPTGTRLNQAPWNSGNWMIFGVNSPINLNYGNAYIQFYGPFIFSNASNANISYNNYGSYYNPGSGTPGGTSGYTTYYWDHSYSSTIKINNKEITLSASERSYSSNNGYSFPYTAPTLGFTNTNGTAMAIRLPDNMTFSQI